MYWTKLSSLCIRTSAMMFSCPGMGRPTGKQYQYQTAWGLQDSWTCDKYQNHVLAVPSEAPQGTRRVLHWIGGAVCVRTDNSATVHYVNYQENTRSLFCLKVAQSFVPVHVWPCLRMVIFQGFWTEVILHHFSFPIPILIPRLWLSADTEWWSNTTVLFNFYFNYIYY